VKAGNARHRAKKYNDINYLIDLKRKMTILNRLVLLPFRRSRTLLATEICG
jgi:hypothetical protein